MNQNSKTSGAFSVAAPFLFLMFFAASVACRDNTAPSLTSVTPEIRSDDHADLDDWTLIDLAKTEVKFSDFRGEVIFLNRWATWCGPCVHEMPTIQALYEKMGDRIKISPSISDHGMVSASEGATGNGADARQETLARDCGGRRPLSAANPANRTNTKIVRPETNIPTKSLARWNGVAKSKPKSNTRLAHQHSGWPAQKTDSPTAREFHNKLASVVRHAVRYALGDVHTNTIEGFWSLLKRAWYPALPLRSHLEIQLPPQSQAFSAFITGCFAG